MRRAINCTGNNQSTHGPGGFLDLKERAREWTRLEDPAALISRSGVSDMIGTDPFCIGPLDHLSGAIGPVGYCRDLVRAAIAARSRRNTHMRATQFNHDGEIGRVEIPNDDNRRGITTGMDPAGMPMTVLPTVPAAPAASRIHQSAFTANQVLKAT